MKRFATYCDWWVVSCLIVCIDNDGGKFGAQRECGGGRRRVCIAESGWG